MFGRQRWSLWKESIAHVVKGTNIFCVVSMTGAPIKPDSRGSLNTGCVVEYVNPHPAAVEALDAEPSLTGVAAGF